VNEVNYFRLFIKNFKVVLSSFLEHKIVVLFFKIDNAFMLKQIIFKITKMKFNYHLYLLNELVTLEKETILNLLNQTESISRLLYFDSIVEVNQSKSWYVSRPIWSPTFYDQLDYLGSLLYVSSQDFSLFEKIMTLSKRDVIQHFRIHNLIFVYNFVGYKTNSLNDIQRKVLSSNSNLINKDYKVSIIVPTKFAKFKNEIQCLKLINSINKYLLNYKEAEIVLLFNDQYLSEWIKLENSLISNVRIRIITYRFNFNFSKVINLGIRESNFGNYLIINDDVNFIDFFDLNHSIKHLDSKEIKAVGFNLLYSNTDIVQHAGIEYRNGEPQHFFQGTKIGNYKELSEYCREVSGVTGAALLITDQTINEFGFFNENYPLDYGDVEYMLRIRKKQGMVLLCRGLFLEHQVSLSRGITEEDVLLKYLNLLKLEYGTLPKKDEYRYTPLSLNR
jgi:GT2 family glycosyltransferase